jgi:hypothetical protein
MDAQILRKVSDLRRLYFTLHSLRKCKAGFIQGTPNDCLSILLFLRQANVCRLGRTLVKTNAPLSGLGGVGEQSAVVLFYMEPIED